MLPHDPDRLLLQALHRSGPRARAEAFARLYERHRAHIHALCQRRTCNEEDALDALQETFIAAASQIDRFRGEALFSTWLHRVAVNKCGEIQRRRRRRMRLEQQPVSDSGAESCLGNVADQLPLPAEVASDAERDGRVRAAVDALPGWLRVAVQLRYFEHRPYEEIAAVLSVPVGTVKSRLFRAHRSLARELCALSLSA